MQATATATALAVRNVLLATDFSPCSQKALLHALTAARWFGSTLHLVHVVQPRMFSMVPPEAYAGCAEASSHTVELATTDAEALLGSVLRRTHCEDLKHNVLVRVGEVGETLRAIMEREYIDLAVVGTHGRTGLRKFILGSVAEEVFRQAACPVMTIGPNCWQPNPQAFRLKHVLFPANLSVDSARALPYAMALAAEFNARLLIVHVVESLSAEAAHDRARVIAVLEERMRKMIPANLPMPPQIDLQVEFGDVVGRILEIAARLESVLIVSGLKAPDTSADKLPWEHAYKVACSVGCPVLTLRGPRYRGPARR